MLILALALLQAAPLVHYDDLPAPTRQSVQSCSASYDRLERFVGEFNTGVFKRELDRGGRLTWSQGNDIRYAADLAARPYLERIRYIAYTGDALKCHALADAGVEKITNEVIMPVFGHR